MFDFLKKFKEKVFDKKPEEEVVEIIEEATSEPELIEEPLPVFEEAVAEVIEEISPEPELIEEPLPVFEEAVTEVVEEIQPEPELIEEPLPVFEEAVTEVVEEIQPEPEPIEEPLSVFEEAVTEVVEEIQPESELIEEPLPVFEEAVTGVVEEIPPEPELIEEPLPVFEKAVTEVIEEKLDDRPKGWFGLSFASLKEKISKTSEALISNVLSLTQGKEKLDDDIIDELEESLIKADLGLETTMQIIEKLRENKNKISPNNLKDFLKQEYSSILLAGKAHANLKYYENTLNVYLITGVNGVGKTTLIGKLAYRFKEQGKNVLIAAGDTFRAAAEEQLNIWSRRAGADIVRRDGADPASVVFDAISKAKKDKYDVLLIDTAGRLHNKFNLMEELRKIKRIIDKNADGNFAESILVLDATTGQNGLQQAKVFAEAVQLTSVALTKLDGSAKGGIIFSIASEMQLPVKLVGVGEKIDDLRDFDPNLFIEALFN